MGIAASREPASSSPAVLLLVAAVLVHLGGVFWPHRADSVLSRLTRDALLAGIIGTLILASLGMTLRAFHRSRGQGFPLGLLAFLMTTSAAGLFLIPSRFVEGILPSSSALPFALLGSGAICGFAGLFVGAGREWATASVATTMALPVLALFSFGGMATADGLTATGGRFHPADVRECRMNCKLLEGALEMYELDKGLTKGTAAVTWEDLRKADYIPAIPLDPGEGAGTSYHYDPSRRPVTCSVHGGLEDHRPSGR